MNFLLLHKRCGSSIPTFLAVLMLGFPVIGAATASFVDQERFLTEVFDELGEKYQVFFNYEAKSLHGVKVDFEFRKEEKLQQAVDRLLAQTDLRYDVVDERYFIIYHDNKQSRKSARKIERKLKQLNNLQRKSDVKVHRNSGDQSFDRTRVLLEAVAAQAPRVNVTGTVLDETGEPLIGVTVLIEGTTTGTVTDFDGTFEIDVEDENASLVFSYTGYLTKTIPLEGRSQLDIIMEVEVSALEEVVVVGYGTQKKVNLTGAVASVGSESLEKRPIASTGMGLQGLIPNLNISIRNGDPTREADFNIRGYESINGGNPLILVDGVPMDIERINPNDIASVNVLKDASAAAVYGARAAFGVILVETKKGKSGKVNINLSTELSAAKPIFNMDPVTDPYTFVTARNMANIRTNGAPSYTDEFVAATKAFSDGTGPEWGVVDGVLQYYGYNHYQEDLMTDYAPQQKYDMSVSGATEGANYYVSFGLLNKDGYLDSDNNENFKRYNALAKIDFQVNNWLSLDEKVVFNSQVSDKPHFYNWDVNINTVARVNPILPIKFPDLDHYLEPGDRDEFAQYIGRDFASLNFFPYLEQGGRETFTVNDLWLTQGINITPFNGFRIRGEFSYNTYHRNYEDVASKVEVIENRDLTGLIIGNGFSGNDWINTRSDYNQYYVLNTYAEYVHDAMESHFFKAMVGFNQEFGRYTHTRAQANTLITPLVPDLNATTGTQQTFGGKSEVAIRGVFYRLNYIYRDKYLFEANGRYDGTSRFPQDDRFGFFPSFSVGWRISEEGFMDGTRGWLDNLKLRASYGELGNQIITDNNGNQIFYPYVATMGIGTSPYMLSNTRIPFVSAAGLVSPTLTWEKVISRNLGIDITILNQRLDFSFDIYTRDTRDMLTDVEYPAILGTDAPQANAADLRTAGWEGSLTWRDRIGGGDFSYDVTFALSDWQTEITKYDNPTGALSEYYEGQKIGEIWGFETVGIFQSDADVDAAPDQSNIGANWRMGDIQYADLNGDGEISRGNETLDDPGDLTIIGNSTPRLNFGINLNVRWRNLSLRTFFQGIGKRDYWPSSGNWTWFFPFNAGHVENYFITDSWTEDNRDAYFPAAHISTNDKKNLQVQSRFIQQASYMRLKNLTLSYDFSPALVQRLGMTGAQVYIAGMNLFEITKIRKPLDPESLHTNVLSGENFNGAVEYPMQRIYSFGANITF